MRITHMGYIFLQLRKIVYKLYIMGKLGDSEQEMLDLVGLIYDAAMYPQRWLLFLERLANNLHAEAALFRLSDTNSNQVHMDFSHGHDDRYLADYRDYYIHHDPFREPLKRHPAGVFYPGQAAISYEDYAKTEHYNDMFKPRGLLYALGGFALRDGPLAFQVAVHRSKNAGDYTQDEIDHFNRLIPHLQRAFKINRHMARLEQRGSIVEQALDQFNTGVILINEHGVHIYMNRKAEEMIAAQQGLHIVSGRLVASSMRDTATLNRLIRQAIDTGKGKGAHSAGAMHLTPVHAASQPIPVLVTPLNPENRQFAFTGSRICAALFIGAPLQADRPNAEVLQLLYGLTLAEARLAAELARGCSLDEICNRFYISIHTARAQLKIIFQKTCTSRQAELVSLLLGSPAAL